LHLDSAGTAMIAKQGSPKAYRSVIDHLNGNLSMPAIQPPDQNLYQESNPNSLEGMNSLLKKLFYRG
jgi:hypothetical protein